MEICYFLLISMLRCHDTRSLIAKGLLHSTFFADSMVWCTVFSLFNGKLACSFSLNWHIFEPHAILQKKIKVVYEMDKVHRSLSSAFFTDLVKYLWWTTNFMYKALHISHTSNRPFDQFLITTHFAHFFLW